MNDQGDSRELRVSDIMGSELHTIDGLATVAEAMAMMERLQISSLVVNRRNDDDELGLVTVSDLAREVIAPDRAPDRVNVYEVMVKPALTCTRRCWRATRCGSWCGSASPARWWSTTPGRHTASSHCATWSWG